MSAFRKQPPQIILGLFIAACLLGAPPGSRAQPMVISISITNMATNVAFSTPMVFKFSEPMNPYATAAVFLDYFWATRIDVVSEWQSPYTEVRCRPSPPGWPPGCQILWFIEGVNPSGQTLAGETLGMFFTINNAPAVPPVILHARISAGAFEFDVSCSTGQLLVVESNTDLLSDGWQTVGTTNTSSSLIRITDPRPLSSQALFYRVRVGP